MIKNVIKSSEKEGKMPENGNVEEDGKAIEKRAKGTDISQMHPIVGDDAELLRNGE